MKPNSLKLSISAFALLAFSLVGAQDKTNVKSVSGVKQNQYSIEIRFDETDTNKDKTVSLNEFKIKKKEQQTSNSDAQLEKQYARIDTNSDNSVTLEEYMAYMSKKH